MTRPADGRARRLALDDLTLDMRLTHVCELRDSLVSRVDVDEAPDAG